MVVLKTATLFKAPPPPPLSGGGWATAVTIAARSTPRSRNTTKVASKHLKRLDSTAPLVCAPRSLLARSNRSTKAARQRLRWLDSFKTRRSFAEPPS